MKNMPDEFEITLKSNEQVAVSVPLLLAELKKSSDYFHHLVMNLLRKGDANFAHPGMANLANISAILGQTIALIEGPPRVQIPMQSPMGRA